MPQRSTRKQILSLGAANAISAGLQFVLPVVLVRLIDQDSFGLYKLFWLLVNSVMLFAPLGMTRSLHFFLPRSSVEQRNLFVNQTIVFLCCTGLIGALLVSPYNILLPQNISAMINGQFIFSVFIYLWIVSSVIEVLPAADRRVKWQSGVIVALAMVRFLVVAFVAWSSRDVNAIFHALLGFAILKCVLLLYYYFKYSENLHFRLSVKESGRQLKHAIPFGISGVFNRLRIVSEQWVVATLFSSAAFGIYSVAVAVMPLLNTIKQSVGFVTLPKMSKLHLEGDIKAVLELNNNGNLVVTFVMFPIAAFLFAFANDIVVALYTDSFAPAAAVLRMYSVVALVLSVDIATVLIVLGQGQYVMRVSILLVIVTIISSYAGARTLGLPGGALGSVIAVSVASILYFRRVSRLTSVPLKSIQRWVVIGKIFLAALLASIIAYSVVPDIGEYLVLLLGMLIGAILYFGFLFLAGEGWLLRACIGKGNWKKSI